MEISYLDEEYILAVLNFHFLFFTFPFPLNSIFSSILFSSSNLFYSILLCSILFCSVLFCSALLSSVLFCSVLFCSVLFYSILFYSIHALTERTEFSDCLKFLIDPSRPFCSTRSSIHDASLKFYQEFWDF